MIVLDASVVIALLDGNDAHHQAAVTLIDDAEPPLIMHPINVAEVLVAPAGLGLAREVHAGLVEIGLEVDTTPIDPVRLAELRAATGLKIPDCCVVISAADHGCRFETFDARLAAER